MKDIEPVFLIISKAMGATSQNDDMHLTNNHIQKGRNAYVMGGAGVTQQKWRKVWDEEGIKNGRREK